MDKQTQILTAALKLFVTFGFHGTPTIKIAEEAGVANGTLFHYYKTKDELVVGLYNQIRNEFALAISTIHHEDDFITTRFKNVFIQSVNWALSNRDKYYYLQQFQLSPHLSKIPREILEEQSSVQNKLIAEAIRKKLLKQQPVEFIFTLYNSQVLGVYQYLTRTPFSPEEQKIVISQAYEYTWDMLKYY